MSIAATEYNAQHHFNARAGYVSITNSGKILAARVPSVHQHPLVIMVAAKVSNVSTMINALRRPVYLESAPSLDALTLRQPLVTDVILCPVLMMPNATVIASGIVAQALRLVPLEYLITSDAMDSTVIQTLSANQIIASVRHAVQDQTVQQR